MCKGFIHGRSPLSSNRYLSFFSMTSEADARNFFSFKEKTICSFVYLL